jgi:hypothetical protein
MSNIKYKIYEDSVGVMPSYDEDNLLLMGIPGQFSPNAIGLYDMIGNVSEMISEKGKAKGGSWNSYISECYIDQVQEYESRNPEVGFRLFMEVIEN